MAVVLLVVGAALVTVGAGVRWGWTAGALVLGALLLAAGVDASGDVVSGREQGE